MRKTGLAALVFAIAAGAPTISHAEGCRLAGITLDCGSGNDASILAAMASTDTANTLSKPLETMGSFNKPSDMETFRRSIEANWKRVNRAERAERRRLKRRQISDAEFSEWSKGYNAARTNYDAAMTLYRNLVWFGKTGKAPPKG